VTSWIIRAVVDGPVDEQTGYLCDIKKLDAMLSGVAVARLLEQGTGYWKGVRGTAAALLETIPRLASVRACETPKTYAEHTGNEQG